MATNLASIYGGSPLGGAVGIQTCSIYRLDPTGTVPLEPVLDLVPGMGPLRVTLDAIDQETFRQAYRVTRQTLQDFSDTTSNVYKELQVLTVSGVFAAGGVMGVGVGTQLGTGLVRLARLDLQRINYLRQIADARQPVMAVTPLHSLARAFIMDLSTPWTPEDGHSVPVSITFLEARVIGPAAITAFADADSLATGNNASAGGGQGGGEIVDDIDFLNPLELRAP